jgi:hypothetical protein
MTLKTLDFPKIEDPRGNLTFFQFPQQIPFKIERTFWTYDVPGGEIRGGHAYKIQEEIIIALSGSFDLVITNKNGKQERFHLKSPNQGIYLPPNTWRHLENFSTNSFSLHLSNMSYSESDYIRNLNEYLEIK